MSRGIVSVLVLCAALALPSTWAQAKKPAPYGHGTFRRADVIKHFRIEDPNTLWVRGLRGMLTPYNKRVSQQLTSAKNPERFMLVHFMELGRIRTNIIAVPLDRKQPVRTLSVREIRSLGLRAPIDAMAKARYNGGKYGKPQKPPTFGKVRVKEAGGSGRISYRFTQKLDKPIVTRVTHNNQETLTWGIGSINRSVPILRDMTRGETAHPQHGLLKVEPRKAKK